ncbi:MAG TPA: gephyrin-like molybdotransferase Glp [Stenotrophomonas sp.]
MIGYADALQHLLDAVAPLSARPVPLEWARDAVLAQCLVSPQCLPPFDNSAMDGFALHAGLAEIPAGSEFDVQGRLAAGDAFGPLAPGVWEIMTGAPMPPGLDSVVPIEQVEVLAHRQGQPSRIRLRQSIRPGQHVRLRGQDVATGAAVLPAGTRLGINETALLHALGIAQVPVRPAPAVAVLVSGRELVSEVDQRLLPGQIHDSNRPYLVARLQAAGAQVVWQGSVDDDPALFNAAIDQASAAGAQIVVSTGAVSMGCHDFIPDALRARGATIVFHKVAMRPGKPLLFARLPDGALYFGLPGNPLSAAAGQRFFVEPLLRRMLGLPEEVPLRLPLQAPLRKLPGVRMHALARVTLDAQQRLGVQALPHQHSFRLMSLLRANAWVVPEDDAEDVPAGTWVRVYGLGHHDAVRLEAAGPDDAQR